jgi:hypothetical protein
LTFPDGGLRVPSQEEDLVVEVLASVALSVGVALGSVPKMASLLSSREAHTRTALHADEDLGKDRAPRHRCPKHTAQNKLQL